MFTFVTVTNISFFLSLYCVLLCIIYSISKFLFWVWCAKSRNFNKFCFPVWILASSFNLFFVYYILYIHISNCGSELWLQAIFSYNSEGLNLRVLTLQNALPITTLYYRVSHTSIFVGDTSKKHSMSKYLNAISTLFKPHLLLFYSLWYLFNTLCA